MTAKKAAEILSNFNKWRRGEHEDIEQPLPKEIGQAIDKAVEVLENHQLKLKNK